MRDSRIRCAVIGLGSMGRQHLRTLSSMDDIVIVGAVERNSDTRAEVAARFGVPTYETSAMLPLDDLEAAVIAVPTESHAMEAEALLGAGIDVLVEKPIAETVDEAMGLALKAKANDRILMVGHVERYNPAVDVVNHMLAEGVIGNVLNFVARRVGFTQPANTNSSVTLDLAIHDVDTLTYLLGCSGELLWAHALTLPGRHGDDHVDIGARFGTICGSLQANWLTPMKIRTLSLAAGNGLLHMDYVSQSVDWYARQRPPDPDASWDLFSATNRPEPISIPVDREEPLRREIRDFLRAIRHRSEPIATAEGAISSLQLVNAARHHAVQC